MGVSEFPSSPAAALPHIEDDRDSFPTVVGLQPVALVDHVARVDWTLLDAIPGERGGSQRVTVEELEHILTQVNMHILPSPQQLSPIRTIAGGSVANTVRGLAAGFGISCAIVGACGDDEQGQMFVKNMEMARVSLSRLRIKRGPTGQCACLVDAEGNRTMRPCLSDAVRLQANELIADDIRGSKWVVLNGYGFYGQGLVEDAVHLAKKEGAFVSMDLASFEVVRNFRSQLLDLLKSGQIDLCFANEDEARELMREEPDRDAESALAFLASYCSWAVVMLGPKGCIARHGKEIARVPAIKGAEVIDTTGAGDLFASGFLYGMIKDLSLADCCRIGCCTGGAVVRALGGEVEQQSWQWAYEEMRVLGLPIPKFAQCSTNQSNVEQVID
uniref:Carbohydrate kinase PfkB domain-containing protein n=1 Tax=Araucaria cunninghamii TaxID=56994 RepID=A0A0D6R0N9_ARACU